MVRVLILRILSVLLLLYILYVVYRFVLLRRGSSTTGKSARKRESTDYDKEEWEKIKKELEKK